MANIKVRKEVFETNSSSVHSLVIASEGREPSVLPVDDEGYILADFGNFGKEYEIYNSQADKLSYLLTCVYYLTHGWDIESVYEHYDFRHIEEAVCEYAGARGIKIIGACEPELDHQSIPYGNIEIINTWDKDEIINFVFNHYIALKTDCD